MRYLFEDWAEIASRIRRAHRIFLLTDFDGTLTPIVERPEDAILSKEIRDSLASLAKNHRYMVGIISGRDLRDLMSRVGVAGVTYAGNHGLEIHGKGLSFVEPIAQGMQSLLRVLHHALSVAFRGIEGVFVEDKGLTLSIHYRMAKDREEDRIKEIVDRITGPLHAGGRVKVTTGKKVYEVRPPVAWDKGKAIEWLLARGGVRPGDNTWPVFVGDDVTDEDGFAVVNRRNGISVFVGEPAAVSRAVYYLPSPQEVGVLLTRLVDIR